MASEIDGQTSRRVFGTGPTLERIQSARPISTTDLAPHVAFPKSSVRLHEPSGHIREAQIEAVEGTWEVRIEDAEGAWELRVLARDECLVISAGGDDDSRASILEVVRELVDQRLEPVLVSYGFMGMLAYVMLPELPRRAWVQRIGEVYGGLKVDSQPVAPMAGWGCISPRLIYPDSMLHAHRSLANPVAFGGLRADRIVSPHLKSLFRGGYSGPARGKAHRAALLKAAWKARTLGVTLADFRSTLLMPENKLGEGLRGEDGHAYIAGVWGEHDKPLASRRSQQRTLLEVDAWEATALAQIPMGRTSTSARKAVRAIADRCRVLGRTTSVPLPVRGVVEMSDKTFRLRLDELLDAELLVRTKDHTHTLAAEYTLLTGTKRVDDETTAQGKPSLLRDSPPISDSQGYKKEKTGPCAVVSSAAWNEVFSPGGLPPASAFVFEEVLRQGAPSLDALADTSRYVRQTIERAAARLDAAGLIRIGTSAEGLVFTPTTKPLVVAALELGTYLRVERRRQVDEHDRRKRDEFVLRREKSRRAQKATA